MRDDSGVQIDFRPMDAALPPASDLLAAMVAEMGELYGDIEGDHMPSAKPADFAPPAGTFLVGFHDGEPVCAGGIKRNSRVDVHAETGIDAGTALRQHSQKLRVGYDSSASAR